MTRRRGLDVMVRRGSVVCRWLVCCLAWCALSELERGCAAPGVSTPAASSAPAASSEPVGSSIEEPVVLPRATVKPNACALDAVHQRYRVGQWKEAEQLIQKCLAQNPLQTEARLILVRIYLMRAYAAREPRWLDEARRQLKMVEGDPAYQKESEELLLLIDRPTVE